MNAQVKRICAFVAVCMMLVVALFGMSGCTLSSGSTPQSSSLSEASQQAMFADKVEEEGIPEDVLKKIDYDALAQPFIQKDRLLLDNFFRQVHYGQWDLTPEQQKFFSPRYLAKVILDKKYGSQASYYTWPGYYDISAAEGRAHDHDFTKDITLTLVIKKQVKDASYATFCSLIEEFGLESEFNSPYQSIQFTDDDHHSYTAYLNDTAPGSLGYPWACEDGSLLPGVNHGNNAQIYSIVFNDRNEAFIVLCIPPYVPDSAVYCTNDMKNEYSSVVNSILNTMNVFGGSYLPITLKDGRDGQWVDAQLADTHGGDPDF